MWQPFVKDLMKQALKIFRLCLMQLNMHQHFTVHSEMQQTVHHNLVIEKRIKWIQQIVWKHSVKRNLMLNEGADFLIVKPGLSYLDIIRDVKNTFIYLLSLIMLVVNIQWLKRQLQMAGLMKKQLLWKC